MIRTPSLRALDLFSTLMRTRSISEAARCIGISQPAASLALKELEAQTGLPLFVRTRQRLVPTPQAGLLLPQIERLIDQANRIQRQIVALRGKAAPMLHLACTPSFGSTLLPSTIAGFQREHPGVQLKIDVEPLSQVLDLLRQEAVDLAFCYLPQEAEEAPMPERGQERLLSTPLAGLMAPDHPLAARTSLDLSDLAQHRVILATRNNLPIPATIVEGLRGKGTEPGTMEVNNVYTAMSFARAGIGIALANPVLLVSGIAGGLIARPITPGFQLSLGVVRALPHAHTPEIEALIDHARHAALRCRQQLGKLGIDSKIFGT
ncbi:MAG: hypothetical protein JWP20_869 [Roseomonas sp.]|jgi:DNA-binding transcriptional LysR family regulator|nr:hypothetical protein [Roseomonas sp.]